ncbi:sensor histidine kinase [Chitinophaga parva]|uniref:Sensor histidine kinase n=1 Tax=Chitinophaga parva TaxID=2169414 RepID=A0A2T7BCH7_9BACT|nr:histidine kinase [Chitinophaga parva]PUZ22801.1 sensor histidine kinase [Chitinophaga parva]
MKQRPHISRYWKCQLIGWSAAALYWGVTGWMGQGFRWSLAVSYFVSDVVLYILLTHAYRNLVLRLGWQRLPLPQLLWRIIPADLVLSLAYMVTTITKIYLLRMAITGFSQPFAVFFADNWLPVLVAGLRLMTIWVLAYHLYHYAQREIIIARENARLEVITKEAQLNNLSAQLNPHFFFNSLNNIKSLIIENPTAARRGVDLMAALLRSSLYNGDRQQVTLQAELDLVNDYLELEKMRLEERLRYHISVDDALLEQHLPRLSVQTLVENAIKHGVSVQKAGGDITVTVIRNNGMIEIKVQNPGQLDVARSNMGLGLKNLGERIRLQYPAHGVFEITAQEDGTVLATLLIPVT